MSDVQFCEAKPQIVDGSAVHCPHAARLWDVSKDGRAEQLKRCEGHAARLRANGFTVKLAGTAAKRKWDMTSTHSLEAGAEYLRKQADATVVLVIRPGDAVLALVDGLDQKDVPKLLYEALPDAYARLDAKDKAEREKRVRKHIRSGVNPEESRVA